ncbi:MAG: type II secretion system secretin GspD [Myxococcota bacterium]|nr:type II secretion system secretin GspD [Myxococcota bacterium]MDW8360814.1 type II secretion system secretin GspD [Myxococcales bacterium]
MNRFRLPSTLSVPTAAAVLGACAGAMLIGLVHAQERPAGPRPRLPDDRLGPLLQKQRPQTPTGPTGSAPGEGQPPDGQARPPSGPPAAPGTGTGTRPAPPALPGNLQPFETGIDYRPTSPGARVTFNLEDADLPDLVRLISSITGKRFILPGKLRSIKATVYAPTQVTAAEAYEAFLSILQLNGMTVVPSGRYLKIVESAGIETQPLAIYGDAAAAPADDRFITRLHRLEYVSAEDVANLLGRFKSREGNVTAYAPTNTLILTDTGSNVRRMLRLVEEIDIPRTGEQIWVHPVHHASATELAQRLQEIFPVGQTGPPGSGRPSPPRPVRQGDSPGSPQPEPGAETFGASSAESRISKILADDRTNSLVILATERAYLRIVDVLRELDVPVAGSGRVHVHDVQHGDAEELAQTLQNVIQGGRGGGQGGGQGAASGGSGPLFEGEVRVTAHKARNALVVTSSPQDYAALRAVIQRLDQPRRQVFIEAVIMELSVNRSRSFGLSMHGGVADFPTDGSLSILGFHAQGSLGFGGQEALTSLALGVRGPTIPGSQQLVGISVPAFGVALNAIATSGDANVLATPHILAMDNVEAEISVGENVPLQTSVGLGGLAGLGGLLGLGGLAGAQGTAGAAGAAGLAGLAGLAGGFGTAVPRQDVGTTLRITPHINEQGEIRLEIQEEISEAGAATEGTLGVRSVTKRTAKTQLVVRDQQTVVIGGLMRDVVTTSERKIPILGDIPLLGALFRHSTRETQKRNLLLFLTPYIIRQPSDLRAIFERKMRERQEFLDRYFVFGDAQYEPAIDWSRTRGMVAEIWGEIARLDEEARLLEQARSRPPPAHVPRPAVGASLEPEPEADATVIGPDAPQASPQGEGAAASGAPVVVSPYESR